MAAQIVVAYPSGEFGGQPRNYWENSEFSIRCHPSVPGRFATASIHPLTVGNADGQAFGYGLGGMAIGDNIIDAAVEQLQLQPFIAAGQRGDYHQLFQTMEFLRPI